MTIRGPVFTIRQPWWVPPGPSSHWDFPNIALQAKAQLAVAPVGEVLDETVPRQPTPNVLHYDFPFPNIALQAFAQLRIFPVGQCCLWLDRPARFYRSFDFQFPNVALQAAAQLQAIPVGETLDETVPRQPNVLRYDFPFPNVVLQAAAQLRVAPVGETLDETVPPPRQRLPDVLPPNLLAIQPVATGVPVGEVAGFDRPAPQAKPQDFTFPNIALAPTVFVFRSPLIAWPAPVVRQQDALPPNLTALVPAVVAPVGETLLGDRPPVAARPRDGLPPNIPVQAAAQLQVPPVGEAVGFDRPAPVVVRQDGPIPNLLTTVFSVVGPKPAVQLLYSDRPLPRQPPQDFAFPNIALAPTTFVFRSPLIAWPKPVVRGVEALPPNLVIRAAAPVQAPLVSPMFGDRPVRVAVPRDGPIPNLLTTTLSVVVPKPFSVPLFLSSDRPRPQQRVQDPPLPNILLAVLQTVQLTPVKQIVFTERPARTFVSFNRLFPDTIYPNLVVHTKGRFPGEITDTEEYLQLPVNAVMAGNQPLKVGATVIEANITDVRTKTTVATEGPKRLSKEPSTFRTKTDNKGYD